MGKQGRRTKRADVDAARARRRFASSAAALEVVVEGESTRRAPGPRSRG